jgi:hypothetical protein
MIAICPHCGQRMLLRYGVRLTPHLADIFDAIARRGDHGIAMEALAAVIYPGKPSKAARDALHVNISKINDRLVETDKRLRMQPRHDGFYRLITVAPRRVVKIAGAA